MTTSTWYSVKMEPWCLMTFQSMSWVICECGWRISLLDGDTHAHTLTQTCFRPPAALLKQPCSEGAPPPGASWNCICRSHHGTEEGL